MLADQPLEFKKRSISSSFLWVAVSFLVSSCALGLGVSLAGNFGLWQLNHVAVQSLIESAGLGIGFATGFLLLTAHQLRRGTSFNVVLAVALITTAVLNLMQASGSSVNTTTWLHSLATYAGGVMLALVWVPAPGRQSKWQKYGLVTSMASCFVVAGMLNLVLPVFAPSTIDGSQLTMTARGFHIAGGSFMILAAARLFLRYQKDSNPDDLLFAVYCLSMAGAAFLFEFSATSSFGWCCWTGLRLLALCSILVFSIENFRHIQIEADELQRNLSLQRSEAFATAAEATHIAEKAYEELEQKNHEVLVERQVLNKIVNSIPHAVFWKDAELNYLGCNHRFAEDCGLDHPDQIIGMSDFDLPWTFGDALLLRQSDRDIILQETHSAEAEETKTLQNGEKRILLTNKSPLLDEKDDKVGVVGSYLDVTETRQAEKDRERLMQESVELAHVIRESPDEVFIFSRGSLKFLTANKGACHSTGYSEEELKALTPLDLKPEFEEDKFRDMIQPLASGAVSHLEFQTNHLKKNGDTYPVKISLHASDYQGQAVYVAFVSDLTEVKNLEQRLALSQRLESIGQLSTGIAHEINTPLQFLSDNISFLDASSGRLFEVVDAYRDQLNGEEKRSWEQRIETMHSLESQTRFEKIREQIPLAIDDCKKGIDRTVTILKAMKEFSHPGSREKIQVDLNEAIENTLTIARNRWKYSAVVEKSLAEDLPRIPAFAADVNQVLLNLVVNAADAINERFGEGTLGKISVQTEVVDRWVQLSVQDNGCGMTDEVKQKVFDPFFTTKAPGKGTGQGLSITHNVVVKLHHGQVDVESQRGVGTRFVIRLPIEPDVQNESNEQEASRLESTATVSEEMEVASTGTS